MEEQLLMNRIITSIIQIAFDNLPVDEGWTKFDIDVVAVSSLVTVSAHYHTDNGKRVSFNPRYNDNTDENNDPIFLFLDLRDVMYRLSPNKGAWFECHIEVNNNGSFTTKYNYDEKPNFRYWPSREKFLDDLKKYPRDETSIPNWLNQVINQK